MLRSGKEGWRRAGFELVIVFLGVLVALLVDGWNQRRMDRGLEREYLVRLAQDVSRDAEALRDLAQALEEKSAALVWLGALDAAGLAAAPDAELVPRLVHAHSAGFGVLRGISTTFEDLRSTGNLALVADPTLRAQIVSYYEAWIFNADRVEARRSRFPGDVYSLLPPAAYNADVYFDAPSTTTEVQLDRAALSTYLLREEGRAALRGELNYARFFAGVVRDLGSRAQELMAALE
jgi:hypothetical protein